MTLFEKVLEVPTVETARILGLNPKPKGNRYWCKCPFHTDKTPSMLIYEGTRGFCCFSCHSGGDSIKLYQLVNDIDSYAEAGKQLASDLGICDDEEQPKRKTKPVLNTYELERILNRWRARQQNEYENNARRLKEKIDSFKLPESGTIPDWFDECVQGYGYCIDMANFFAMATIEELEEEYKAQRERGNDIEQS